MMSKELIVREFFKGKCINTIVQNIITDCKTRNEKITRYEANRYAESVILEYCLEKSGKACQSSAILLK